MKASLTENTICEIKGIVHPQVVSNLCECLSSVEQKEDVLKNVGYQTISGPL